MCIHWLLDQFSHMHICPNSGSLVGLVWLSAWNLYLTGSNFLVGWLFLVVYWHTPTYGHQGEYIAWLQPQDSCSWQNYSQVILWPVWVVFERWTAGDCDRLGVAVWERDCVRGRCCIRCAGNCSVCIWWYMILGLGCVVTLWHVVYIFCWLVYLQMFGLGKVV